MHFDFFAINIIFFLHYRGGPYMSKEVINSWGMNEFRNLALGDKRLTDRLIRVIDSFTNVNCNELLTPYCNELLTPLRVNKNR